MARQIVIQPNGLYACWSTVVNDFVKTDLTEKQYIKFRAKESYRDKKKEMKRTFKDIKLGSFFGVMDHEECMEILNRKEWKHY